MTFYHFATIAIEKGPVSKFFHSDLDAMFVKNWAPVQLPGVQLSTPNPKRRRYSGA